MSSLEFKVDFDLNFTTGQRGRKRATSEKQPASTTPGTLPRITKLMALAVKLDGQVRGGELRDYAEIARVGHVTRARVTQIMNFLHLAPDIQEAILSLPRTQRGHDPISERDIRPIAAVFDWRKQRRMWRELCESCGSASMEIASH
jgi:hypothetical protein